MLRFGKPTRKSVALSLAAILITTVISRHVAQWWAWRDHELTFGTGAIAAHVQIRSHHILSVSVEDMQTHAVLPLQDAFVLVFKDGHELSSSAMHMIKAPDIDTLDAQEKMLHAAFRLPGRRMCAILADDAETLHARWCIIARENQPYLRQVLTLESFKPVLVSDIHMFHLRDDAAKLAGDGPGLPVINGNFYYGIEHPIATSTVHNGDVRISMHNSFPVDPRMPLIYTAVTGVARPGQLRRDFLHYTEMERARPYRPFLAYDTWFDIGVGGRFGKAAVIDRLHMIGLELTRKREVPMDAFLIDDSWDNPQSVWELYQGYPGGFAPINEVAKTYNLGLGLWISPWGGYGLQKQQRMEAGAKAGYETQNDGLALSGARYYGRMRTVCLNFLRNDHIRYFKFDGIGNAPTAFVGSIFESDRHALVSLAQRLRQANPYIFLSVTKHATPSPFWLRFVDAVWSGGEDIGYEGEGNWRQRWITYRDMQAYRNIVQHSPLFPLNSVMSHGIIYAQMTEHLSSDPDHDFPAEVHSFFGSGTQLQELYISPYKMTNESWDLLAKSAKWAQRNAHILRDTHWIGGDPGKGEAYGWASWAQNDAILVLRNPTAHPQQITIDAQAAFELPEGAPQSYTMHNVWEKNAEPVTLQAHKDHVFTLQPFEVVTLETGQNP